jgi:hypothetical protein
MTNKQKEKNKKKGKIKKKKRTLKHRTCAESNDSENLFCCQAKQTVCIS